MSHKADRTLAVRALARVEGEGAMHVRVRGGAVEDVRLEIYEPPRFFEALLRGRRHTEPPDITARICGICPVAYQMSACLAIEAACGVEVVRGGRRSAPAALLRRVDRKPRAAHLPAARARLPRLRQRARPRPGPPRPGRARAGAEEGRQRDHGTGRRPGDPSGQRPGGRLLPGTGQDRAGPAGRAAARRARPGAWTPCAGWPGSSSPTSTTTTRLLALVTPGQYAIDRGTVASTGGLRFAAGRVRGHVIEEQVPHSTALHARLAGRGRYLTGPTARYTLSGQWLSPLARQAADAAGPRRRVPQPVPQHPGPRRRGGLRGG